MIFKKDSILKHTETLILGMVWMAIFATPLLVFQKNDTINWENVFIAWTGVLPFFLLFMVNHFLLVPFLLFKHKKVQYLLAVLVLIIGFSLLTFFQQKNQPMGGPPPREGINQPPPERRDISGPPNRRPQPQLPGRNPIPFPPFINTIIISVLIIGFDTGLRMMVRWSNAEKEKNLLEKENVQNQLAFLRNQVSPHFFMNTLNNIHALIDLDTEEAKAAIIKLSKLMRHLLYDSQAEFVPLSKELEFVRSYINLMKLRFSDKVKIELIIPDELPEKSIPPLLFTSFLENAFKHGISYQNTSYIRIEFSYKPDDLIFKITNSNPNIKQEVENNGIGIENSKKRLDIIYGNQYSLIIDDHQDDFILTLKIPV